MPSRVLSHPVPVVTPLYAGYSTGNNSHALFGGQDTKLREQVYKKGMVQTQGVGGPRPSPTFSPAG